MSETEGHYQVKSERPPCPPFVSSPGYLPNLFTAEASGGGGAKRSHDRDDNTQTRRKNCHPMDRASAPYQNKFHVGNGEDGKHYWLTPPELRAELQGEFCFDFDACPHPKPADFDGLTCEWGKSTYANIPFGSVIGHDGKKKGPTAWARKAIAENQKGKRVVLLYPIDKWILMMLKAGAEVRNLGDVRWCAVEDGSQGKGTGRHIAAFILEGAVADPTTTLAAGERATTTPSTPAQADNGGDKPRGEFMKSNTIKTDTELPSTPRWFHRLVMRFGKRLYKWSQWCAWKADYWNEWTKMRDEPYRLAKIAAQQHEKNLIAADADMWPYYKDGWILGWAAGYEAKRSLSA